MSDTQWPRYMVFQQGRADQPWQHNSTVHAPDDEMALLNARDVFARRPEAVGMWVVPDSAIYKVTKQELASANPPKESPEFPTEIEFYVFGKPFEQSPCELIGKVSAKSARSALEQAQAELDHADPLWWWLFPADALLSSQDENRESMFSPALEKTYKQQGEYPTVTMMRQLHAKGKLED